MLVRDRNRPRRHGIDPYGIDQYGANPFGVATFLKGTATVCNIAGYIGGERAAPKLIDMIRRQEGLNGGYYTGIATIGEDGRLYSEKVIGDVETLLRETSAAQLPGKVGIIHSRTESGGDREWGHPFIGSRGDLAYIANGSDGKFGTSKDPKGIAGRLAQAGYPFLARSKDVVGDYPLLPDGSCVHMSEVMCRLIESLIDNELDPPTAMRDAFINYPAEIVGLMLHGSMPGAIIATRVNQPLMIGRHRGGWLMASTALAFDGEQVEWTVPMPLSSTATFSSKGFKVDTFQLEIPLSRDIPWEKGRERVLELLEDGEPRPLSALKNGTDEIWDQRTLSQSYMMLYEMIRSLKNEGKIQWQTVHVPGVVRGQSVPQTQFVMRI